MTKIIHRNCNGCNRELSMFVTDTSIVLGVRCPDCLKEFNEDISNMVPAL